MNYETAITLFASMPPAQQEAVVMVFVSIAGAFTDVREAFIEAVIDEAYVVGTEMRLLATMPAAGMMQ